MGVQWAEKNSKVAKLLLQTSVFVLFVGVVVFKGLFLKGFFLDMFGLKRFLLGICYFSGLLRGSKPTGQGFVFGFVGGGGFWRLGSFWARFLGTTVWFSHSKRHKMTGQKVSFVFSSEKGGIWVKESNVREIMLMDGRPLEPSGMERKVYSQLLTPPGA